MRARCVGVASRSACGCVGVGCCSGGAASARLGLVLVSARASTGRLAGALAGVSGCGLRGAQGSTFVRWDLEDSALATGSRHQCRSARVSEHEGKIVGARGGGGGSASPFSWHGPRLGRSTATSDLLGGGSTTCRALRRWQIHRWPAQGQSLASTAGAAARDPSQRGRQPPGRGPFGDHTRTELRQRSPTRARSRASAAAPSDGEATPTQQQGESKPRRRSPTRARSHANAPLRGPSSAIS